LEVLPLPYTPKSLDLPLSDHPLQELPPLMSMNPALTGEAKAKMATIANKTKQVEFFMLFLIG
jgi:hypothetical protein